MVNRNARSEHDNTTHRRRRGTSTVEMAFVLPILILVVFAIGDFGLAFTRLQNLTNAAREGARVGVVFRANCNAGTVTTLINTTVDNYATNVGIPAGTVSTTVTGACGGTNTPLTVRTTVPYNYVALAPLAGLAPTTNLNATSTMRNE